MIKSFRDKDTAAVFRRERPSRLSAIAQVALRKLQMLNAASDVGDLRHPPGNRLEMLSGDREGQWSIRINRQWRVCFRWIDNGAWDVEIVDYH